MNTYFFPPENIGEISTEHTRIELGVDSIAEILRRIFEKYDALIGDLLVFNLKEFADILQIFWIEKTGQFSSVVFDDEDGDTIVYLWKSS